MFHQFQNSFYIIQAKLLEKQTSPPDYLTESELISLMEKHSIGTDASISVHINNICERNYVQVVSSSRKLQPTPLGIVLVHGYQKVSFSQKKNCFWYSIDVGGRIVNYIS